MKVHWRGSIIFYGKGKVLSSETPPRLVGVLYSPHLLSDPISYLASGFWQDLIFVNSLKVLHFTQSPGVPQGAVWSHSVDSSFVRDLISLVDSFTHPMCTYKALALASKSLKKKKSVPPNGCLFSAHSKCSTNTSDWYHNWRLTAISSSLFSNAMSGI